MISIERLTTATPDDLIHWMGDEGMDTTELAALLTGGRKKTAMARVEVGDTMTDMILFRSGYFDAVVTSTKSLKDDADYDFEVLFDTATGEAHLYPSTRSEFMNTDDALPLMAKPGLADVKPIMTTMFEPLTWGELTAVMRMAASLYGGSRASSTGVDHA